MPTLTGPSAQDTAALKHAYAAWDEIDGKLQPVTHARNTVHASERTPSTPGEEPEPGTAADLREAGAATPTLDDTAAPDPKTNHEPNAHDQEHPLAVQSRYQHQLHERVGRLRAAIVDALWQDQDDAALVKRARQLGWCCSRPAFRIAAGQPRASLARCRDRLCPLCSKLRGAQAAARTAETIGKMNAPRFITLTLAHTNAPLAEQVDRLLACIRKLRESKPWKKHVAGGVQAIELTYRHTTQLWHVHAHLVVTGSYFPQPQLKAEWLRVTQDSTIVDVRAVHDREKAACYVAKYVAKCVDATTWPPAKIREYAHAMHGRRLLQPFGCCMKRDLDDDDDDATQPGTEHLCHADELQRAEAAGHGHARRAAEIFARLSGTLAILADRTPTHDKATIPPSAAEVEFACRVAHECGHTPEADLGLCFEQMELPPSPGADPCQPPPPSESSTSPFA